MKILVISQYWHPENGVPQRRWTWLAHVLTEAGHEVTALVPPPHYQRQIDLKSWWSQKYYASSIEKEAGPSGERIVRSGFVPSGASLTQRAIAQAAVALGALWVAWRRPGELRDYQPDLVIGTVPALPTAVATRIAARLFRAPYIVDLRDAWPDLLGEASSWNQATGRTSLREKVLSKGPFQIVSMVTRKALNGAFKHAAGLMVTSSQFAEDLRTRPVLRTGGSTPPITTIRNVFPVRSTFIAETSEAGVGAENSLNVLYAGTFGRAQNLQNALEAAELARKQDVEVNLRFVGAGVTREALKEFAGDRNINFTIENRRAAEDLAPIYAWADTALVHLSDWEPLARAVPSKTYELIASRVHISGVADGEAAELIREHEAGVVAAPGDPQALADQWVKLAKNRELLKVCGDGPEWVAREREVVAPKRFLELVEKATEKR